MTANMADRMPFSKLMGVEVVEATRDKVTATLVIRPDLCTAGHIMHGGAVMAFAPRHPLLRALLQVLHCARMQAALYWSANPTVAPA